MTTLGRIRAVSVFFCVIALTARGVHGQPSEGDLRLGSRVLLVADEPSLLCVGGGAFDLLREGYAHGTDGYSGVGLAEFRLGRKFLFAGPLVGILANSDGGAYGYAGFFFDFALGSLRFEPMVSGGGYRRGESKDLGGVFEIHTGANLAYRFDQGARIGLEINHISNGNLHHRNPGVELVLVTLMFPISGF